MSRRTAAPPPPGQTPHGSHPVESVTVQSALLVQWTSRSLSHPTALSADRSAAEVAAPPSGSTNGAHVVVAVAADGGVHAAASRADIAETADTSSRRRAV
jgi:hypothetical protein